MTGGRPGTEARMNFQTISSTIPGQAAESTPSSNTSRASVEAFETTYHLMLSRIYQDGLELRTDLKKFRQQLDISDEERRNSQASFTARLEGLDEQWKILTSPIEDKLQNLQNQLNAMADRLEQSEKNREFTGQEMQATPNTQMPLPPATQQAHIRQTNGKDKTTMMYPGEDTTAAPSIKTQKTHKAAANVNRQKRQAKRASVPDNKETETESQAKRQRVANRSKPVSANSSKHHSSVVDQRMTEFRKYKEKADEAFQRKPSRNATELRQFCYSFLEGITSVDVSYQLQRHILVGMPNFRGLKHRYGNRFIQAAKTFKWKDLSRVLDTFELRKDED
ncbi:hypothetical protein CPLU01_02912 [Colletotrichum plurivorum]|uniref:Uncharacterized protein n=1 Tax=Colletotrichum plurivorum TaxID=2175906 RepID=A0A8H6NL95_9PEZI|nr:hypothetical protein CPLU01_02912 [Colletotrichum plurivorum]